MPSFSLVGVTLCKEKVNLIGDSNDTSGIKNGSAGASSINLQPTQTAGIFLKNTLTFYALYMYII